MKTRAGFVSNSSSSSYVLVLRDEDYQNLVKGTSDLARSILDHIGAEEGQLGSEKIRVISWMDGNCDSLEYFDAKEKDIEAWIAEQKKIDCDIDYEYPSQAVYDCWEDFVNEASEVGFKTSVDF